MSIILLRVPLGILATNYGTMGGMELKDGDANGDGTVDVSDLGILATNYGMSQAVAVPEPATLSMMLLALGGVTLLRQRRCRGPVDLEDI